MKQKTENYKDKRVKSYLIMIQKFKKKSLARVEERSEDSDY